MFDVIRSGIIIAFIGVYVDIVNIVREYSTGNILFMVVVMIRDLFIIKYVVENLGYNIFMGMRLSDYVTVFYFVACLVDFYYGCVRYLLT